MNTAYTYPRIHRLRHLLLTAAIGLTSTATLAQSTALNGRLLASNCFQCHGTDGKGGFERLAKRSANSIYEEMIEMRSEKESEIMSVHALGYTDAQLRAISEYFSKVK